MPNISGVVSQISTDYVAALAAAGYPALTDGRILLGRQHDYEMSAPPRVIFIPNSTTWGPKSVADTSNANGSTRPNFLLKTQQRAVLTETFKFDVLVWGQASPPDPDLDFDVTQALYQALIAVIHLKAVGVFRLSPGKWVDQQASGTQLVKNGHAFMFGVEFDTPVLDALLPLTPSGTKANSTTNLQPADGSAPEVGCTGV